VKRENAGRIIFQIDEGKVICTKSFLQTDIFWPVDQNVKINLMITPSEAFHSSGRFLMISSLVTAL
jgi:hypothetical protein